MLAAWVFPGLVGVIIGAFGKLGSEEPPVWVFILVLVFALFAAYMWLRFPFEITIRDDSVIEVCSVFRRTISFVEEEFIC
jgi:uncharacterized membrane protein YfcA